MKRSIQLLFTAGCMVTYLTGNLYAQSKSLPVKVTNVPHKTESLTFITEVDVKSKEVSKEIAVEKGNTLYIDNAYRNIIIKTSSQPKVKISTTIYYEGENKLTDDQWFEKINLSLKMVGSSVKIKSGSVDVAGTDNLIRRLPGIELAKVQGEPAQKVVVDGNNISAGSAGGSNISASAITTPLGYAYSNGAINSVAYFDGNGQKLDPKYNMKRILTITIPAGMKLDIESKYADLNLPALTGELNVEITNGNLEAENLSNLVLRSKYSSANLADIKTAELSVSNGRLSANNIESLDIDTRASNIEIAAVKKLFIISSNDEYEIEEVGEIHGKKDFGSLRITKLNNSIDINGSSADVRIRNLGAQVSLVKIDDRFANIRIPLNKIKNYAVDFIGSYSSVYGNFEKKALDNIAQPTITSVGKPYITSVGSTNNVSGTQLKKLNSLDGQTVYQTNNGELITVSGVSIVRDTALANTKKSETSTLGNLTARTVEGIQGYATTTTLKADPYKEVTVTGYGNSSAGSYSEAKASSPSITTVGSLSSLSVTGTARTISGALSQGVAQRIASGNTYQRGSTTVAGYPMVTANNADFFQYSNNNTPSRFTAEVGDGKNLKIQIKCPNCTVDLK